MKANPFPPRDYSLDNVRFLLIVCVVFAHLLEICTPFPGSDRIYKWIYAFHMPAFLFLFGYNARFSPRKILFRWCIPYVIFQCVYIWFSGAVLHTPKELQFTTPYWLLWYMLVSIFYQLLLPLFDTEDKTRQIITLVCAFGISLLVGFEETVGYYLSLSRFFVFLPWFLLGYYCKKNGILERLSLRPQGQRLALAVSATAMALLALPVGGFADELLYGSYSYAGCGGAWWMRGTASCMAFAAIVLLCVGLRPYFGRRLPVITAIGQNTWPIFLLHGFVVKVVPVYFPELVSTPWGVVLLCCAIVLLFGNKFCTRAVGYATFSWLEKFPAKKGRENLPGFQKVKK